MVVKTAVVAEAKRESRCHLHRKSFSLFEDPQVRLFNFGQNTVSFHPMQGAGTVLSFGGCVWNLLSVFNIHTPFPLLAERIPAQE